MSQLRRLFIGRLYITPQHTRAFTAKAERRKKKPPVEPTLFPDKLLHKKQRTPAVMYVGDDRAATIIDKGVTPFLQQLPKECDIAIEMNPGIGLLTRQLLKHNSRFRKVLAFETLDHFMPKLFDLQAEQPQRLVVKQGDLANIWKLAYQDKLDGGTRVADLLADVPKRAHNDVPNVVLYGAIGSYQFFKHLINSLVFQNSLLTFGRCEMYLAIPPPIYIHLTCGNDIGYMFYRSTTMLFQMLFEYRFIAQIPREYFLPQQSTYNAFKGNKLGRIKSINPEYLYLVKIVPRRHIFEVCPAIDLPALWFFVKQNCISRRNRIIPNLEKWIPGCGPRLIVNPEHNEPVQPLYDDEEPTKLPKFSLPCTTMTNRDHYPNINIYTQFGDLSPSQMLTLFTQFRRWPEYHESSFLASLENSLLKMEASADESIDGVGLVEEDDVGEETFGEDSPEIEEPIQKAEGVTKARKRKAKS